MKIRLSAQGMSLNVEVTDDKAMTVYRGMAEKLLVHAELQKTTATPKALNKPEVVITRPDKKSSLDTYDDVFEHIRSAIKAGNGLKLNLDRKMMKIFRKNLQKKMPPHRSRI